jgi:hypothetical protein
MTDCTLISHHCPAWEGARSLFVAETGKHLAITRRPLFDAALRLRDEGWPSDTMILIRDGAGVAADIAGRISDVLR